MLLLVDISAFDVYGYPQHDSALSSGNWMNLWLETPICPIGVSEKDKWCTDSLLIVLSREMKFSLSLNSGVKRKMLLLYRLLILYLLCYFRYRETVNT